MKKIRRSVFETNSSSTHALIIMSKEEYDKFNKGEVVLDLYNEKVKPLDENKIFIKNEDGSILYNGKNYDSEYDLFDEEYMDFDDSYATKDYLKEFAEIETKEVDGKVAMSIFRGERF